MTADNRVQIEFVDLPSSVMHNPNPIGRLEFFNVSDLQAVEGIPIAAFYLLVTVKTLVGTQEYVRYAIAHVEDGQETYDVAQTVAAKFFGSLGDWDGESYLWENSPYAAKLLDFKTITVAQYAELHQAVPDFDLGAGVSGNPL